MESAWVPLHSTISFVSHFHYLIQTFLVATVLFLLFAVRRKPKNDLPKLTEQVKDEIIANWKPEPLVPPVDSNHPCLSPKLVDGKLEKNLTINNKQYFNLATSNFLGFVGNKRIEDVAKSAIYKYGVGSCGPRGFYGTVDVHLALERELAEFMHCEEAVLYSYGFATIASAIPAYAKRGDIIYADKGVNFAVQKGLQASRSKIEWFEHNNIKDLENLLKAQAEKDKKNPKKAAVIRRFIVVEGLYAKTANLCPLKEIMELKWKYKVRVFIDESFSFGVIGKTGRGVTEHFGVDVIDVDMIIVSLENAVASTGGFCCGRSFVVGHQRLSGLGYCFSASLPPLLTTAASEALRIMDEEPERFARLHRFCSAFHLAIEKACQGTDFGVQGIDISPLKHIVCNSTSFVEEKLDAIVDELFKNGVIVSRARYLTHDEVFPPTPSIKVMFNSEMTDNEIRDATEKICAAIRHVDIKH